MKTNFFASTLLLSAVVFCEGSLPARVSAQNPDPMFPDGLSHDFGIVQRGSKVYHTFRIVNTSKVPLRIQEVRVSMASCVSARSSKDVLQPNEEGKVEVAMDTRYWVHAKTVRIFFTLDNDKQNPRELYVCVSAFSRDNLAFFPDHLDFGKIQRGDTPTKQMIVAVPDQPKLQVTGAACDSKFIQVKVHELARGTTRAVYQVSATVRADIPAGELHTHVELSTNNPVMPRLLVPITVEIKSPK